MDRESVADVVLLYSERHPNSARLPGGTCEKAGYTFPREGAWSPASDSALYTEGKAEVRLIARPALRKGIHRLLEGGSVVHSVMCAEKDPLDCNRPSWSPGLWRKGATGFHILARGSRESHQQALKSFSH